EATDGVQERVRFADARRPQAREAVNQSGTKRAGVRQQRTGGEQESQWHRSFRVRYLKYPSMISTWLRPITRAVLASAWTGVAKRAGLQEFRKGIAGCS